MAKSGKSKKNKNSKSKSKIMKHDLFYIRNPNYNE